MEQLTLAELMENVRLKNWASGACALFRKIAHELIDEVDYTKTCGRCGWPIEDHKEEKS